MQEFIPIDPQTASKLRMTPEEAQAVVEMWTFHQRMADPDATPYSIYVPPPGATIANSDVRSYLSQIRAMRKRRMREPRPKSADVRLAMMAVAGFVLVVFCATAFYSSQRRRDYPVYGYAPPYVTPVATASAPSAISTTRAVEGYSSFQHHGNRISEILAQQTTSPARFAFSLGRTIFVAAPHNTLNGQVRGLSQDLKNTVGGPVAARSRVPNRPVTVGEAAAALRSAPSEAVVPVAFESGTPAPNTPESALVEWQSIRLAFNGKVTEANIPFARVTDPGLMTEVEREQERVIARLVEIGKKFSDGNAPSR